MDDVFLRREIKYQINAHTCRTLQDRLSDFMEPDDHNSGQDRTYRVCNLYYDTSDNHLIRTSLQKPVYKEKLRLRSYGVPNLESCVYLEIKKKIDGAVCKRRSTATLDSACLFLETGQLPGYSPGQNRQVLREIQYMLKCGRLEPKLYLAYDRLAYFSLADHNLRVSFDTNIRTRRNNLRLEDGDYGQGMLAPDQWILEIKASGSMPLWLTHLLAEYQIYPLGYSKYGAEYMHMLNQNRRNGEEESCLNRSLAHQPVLQKQPSQLAAL